MKKGLLWTIVLLLFFSLTACSFSGGGDEPAPDDNEGKLTITYYDQNGKQIEKQYYNKGDLINYPTPAEIEGYFFLGWFDGNFLFDLEKMPSSSIELHAKYEKGYSYQFLDYDGTVLKEGHGAEGSTITAPEDPQRAKEGTTVYTFAGWDKEITALNENVTYTATYTSCEVAVLTYELDGGNWEYRDYDSVVSALLYDYNRYTGKSYTVGTVPTGAWEAANFHLFFYSGSYKAKWSWLVEYLAAVGGVKNRPALRALLSCSSADSFNKADDNYKYQVSYEFRAFLRGGVIDSNVTYVSADYSEYDLQNGFWSYYLNTVQKAKNVDLLQPRVLLNEPYRQNYKFGGWYDNPEFNGSAITSINVTADTTVYAKWIALTPVSDIVVQNSVTELERFATHTLTWEVLPADAGNKRVKFRSSDPSVLSVSADGKLTTYKEGTVTLNISSVLTPSVVKSYTIVVYSPGHFEVSYETTSYVAVGETITLNAQYIGRDKQNKAYHWESANEGIATVNNGIVTGVASGVATIKVVLDDNSEEFEFFVTVLPNNVSSQMQKVIEANENNVYIQYGLGIGAGTPSYYADITGSVNKMLFEEYKVDTTYEAVQAGISSNHGGTKTSTEFITVHYTGNMSKTADGAANASYFANGGGNTSIHYVTGNDGIYHILDDNLVGFHAGDGTGVKFQWIPTGVMYAEGDPQYPVFGISSDSFFTINGKKTTYPVPAGDAGHPQTAKVTDARWINDMGLSFKIVDGEYYMGTTWWCYSQVSEGRICNHGGNNNSVGIESCVNQGSDLWYTWQLTAQLVAHLMIKFDLDITRVVGHHFYSAKDCPQPMLENDLELWWYFIELVKAEYEVLTTLADYDISFEVLNGSTVRSNGRVRQPKFAECIQYKVTLTNKTTSATEEIVLASVVNGVFDK